MAFGSRWEANARPDVPTRVIVGRDDRFFPAPSQVALAQERIGVAAEVIPGGHLVSLANPSGLAAALLRQTR